jgi:hypothetical protein
MAATGLSFFVTTTRSWVPATSSITWLKWALTVASDCVDMTTQGIVRAGLATILGGRPDIDVIAQAADGREAVALARELRGKNP